MSTGRPCSHLNFYTQQSCCVAVVRMRTLLYQLYQLWEACFLRKSTASVCNRKLSPHEVDQNSIQTYNKSTNKVKQKIDVGFLGMASPNLGSVLG